MASLALFRADFTSLEAILDQQQHPLNIAGSNVFHQTLGFTDRSWARSQSYAVVLPVGTI